MSQVGDPIPSVEVQEGTPNTKVNMKHLFTGKKGVLFAVPGAFTPGCSKVRTSCLLRQVKLAYVTVINCSYKHATKKSNIVGHT